jgi:predicted dehydrogenase
MSVPRPRLAVIGISGYGRIHLALMREWCDRGLATLVAAVVINPVEEQANVAELERRGCKIYADYEQMLREQAGQIDLCLIPTGIHWHARMTIAALRSGANVLVEKPLAGSVAEGEAICAAERETGRFVAVGFQDIYEPSTTWLLDVLRSGQIGVVRSVRFRCVWPRPRSYFLRNNWAGRLVVSGAPVFDSPLNNACGHFVLLGLLFGGVTEEAGALTLDSAELFRAQPIESFDTAVVTMTSARGVRLWFGVTHSSHVAQSPEIVIEGTAGRARWTYEQDVTLTLPGAVTERRALASQQEVRRSMMDAVIRRLADPAARVCTAALAARHTELIDAVHRCGAVREFDAGKVEWAAPSTDPAAIPSVRGLDEALARAFATGSTLRAVGFEAGVPVAAS